MLLSSANDNIPRITLPELDLTTYLVVHIRNVHDKLDVEFEIILHDPSDDIGANIVPCMTEMCIVVDCWATSVPRDSSVLPVNRDEGRFRSGQGVPDLQRWKLNVMAGL